MEIRDPLVTIFRTRLCCLPKVDMPISALRYFYDYRKGAYNWLPDNLLTGCRLYFKDFIVLRIRGGVHSGYDLWISVL